MSFRLFLLIIFRLLILNIIFYEKKEANNSP
jgi:hypothetical protein